MICNIVIDLFLFNSLGSWFPTPTAMDEFEAYLFQAEGAAYQSMFVEHSSAKGTPESLLKTAKGDIINMRKYMSVMAKQLNVNELKIDSTTIISEEANSVEVRGRSRGT